MANSTPPGKSRLIAKAYVPPVAAKPTRQPASQMPLALAALALLMVAGIVAMVVAWNLLRESPAVAMPQLEVAPSTKPVPSGEAPKPKAKSSVFAPSKNLVLPQVGVAQKPKNVAPPEAVIASDPQREALLECVGSLSAMHLYQSYLNLGLLADAYEHETYQQAEAEQILATIVTFVQTLDEQMAKIETGKLEPAEAKTLKEVRQISKKLEKQADLLQEIWEAVDPLASKNYQDLRKETWNEIRTMLGLPEPMEP